MGLNCVSQMFNKLLHLIELKIIEVTKQIEIYDQQKLKWNERENWDLDMGKKFNDLISQYPITEDELLSISKTVCAFVQQTRITNIDKYLFLDKDNEAARLPYMLNNHKETK